MLGIVEFGMRCRAPWTAMGGHVAYAVAPFAQGGGGAKALLRHAMAAAAAQGLEELVLTTGEANVASQRVILGGVGAASTPPTHGKVVPRAASCFPCALGSRGPCWECGRKAANSGDVKVSHPHVRG